MPLIVRDFALYFALLIVLSLLGVPGAVSALIGGIAFAAVIWREVQR
jgi:hypothetical protein